MWKYFGHGVSAPSVQALWSIRTINITPTAAANQPLTQPVSAPMIAWPPAVIGRAVAFQKAAKKPNWPTVSAKLGVAIVLPNPTTSAGVGAIARVAGKSWAPA